MIKAPAYDYIIAGMGCAGLSLAVRLLQSGLPFRKVLLIDREDKNLNDRTWCFWNKENESWYGETIFKKWGRFKFSSPDFECDFELKPYHYQMIRGIDFYNFCLVQIKKDARFEIRKEEIIEIGSLADAAYLKTKADTFISKCLFNSVFKNQEVKNKQVNYIQHFKGWLIETKEEAFDPELPVFMDFNTDQESDCRFFYLIPYSKTKALVEYTGFSQQVLKNEIYDIKIKNYLAENYKGISYTVIETEKGGIPMAESSFINPYGENVINIGVPGGSSKPSTGYTFYFIQKNTEALIVQLKRGEAKLEAPQRQKRFLFYDKILLDVLNSKQIEPYRVFSTLFQQNKIKELLAFLNEESSLREEINIMNSVDKKIFLRSAFKKIIS